MKKRKTKAKHSFGLQKVRAPRLEEESQEGEKEEEGGGEVPRLRYGCL